MTERPGKGSGRERIPHQRLDEFEKRLRALSADVFADRKPVNANLSEQSDQAVSYEKGIETLGDYSSAQAQESKLGGALGNKIESPLFVEGKRLKLTEVNKLFSDLLRKEGYPGHVVQWILQTHVFPSADEVRRLDEVFREGGDAAKADPDNPFAALSALRKQKNAEPAQEAELERVWFRHLHLLHHLITHPEAFDLDPDSEGVATMSGTELYERLTTERPEDVFVKQGARLRVREQMAACQALIREHLPSEAYGICLDKLIRPKLGDIERIVQQTSGRERDELLRERDRELAILLDDLLDLGDPESGRQSGVTRYGNLIVNGVDDAENKVDFPNLRLRLPELHKEMARQERNSKRKFEMRLQYFSELVRERYNGRLDLLEEMVQSRELAADIDYKGIEYEVGIDYDEVGDKPFHLMLAEGIALLERSGYSEEEALKALDVINNELGFFNELQGFRDEYEAELSTHGAESPHTKAVTRKLNNLIMAYVEAIRNRLNDPSGSIKLIDGMAGNTDGLLALEDKRGKES